VIVDNPSYVPLRSTLAQALAGDDPAQARALVAEELGRARELGQPRGIGVALRVQGLLEGGEAAIARLDEAVETLRASPARLELARALCDLGAAMRRGRRPSAAREPLREGLELAERSGAEALARHARAELLEARGLVEERDGPERHVQRGPVAKLLDPGREAGLLVPGNLGADRSGDGLCGTT
jgi:hypothetical protein